MKRFIVFFFILVLISAFAFGIEMVYPKTFDKVRPGKVTLEWIGNDQRYFIYVGNSPNNLTLATTTSSTSFVLEVKPDGIYYWEVVGQKGQFYEYSQISSFISKPLTPKLIFPENNASGLAISSLELKWDGQGTFDIRIGLDSKNMKLIRTTRENHLTISDLIPNTRYYWSVVNNGKYATATSKIHNFTTMPVSTKLLYPYNGEDGVSTSVTFKWSGIPEERYDVYLGETPDNLKEVSSTIFTSFSTNLEYSKQYFWMVKSIGYGDSVQSQIFSFKTIHLAPSSPYPYSGSKNVPIDVQLSWKGEPGVRYNVYIGEQPNELSLVATNLEGNFYVPSNLETNTTYYWKVASVSGTNQNFSPLWSFKTKTGEWHVVSLSISPEFPYTPSIKDMNILVGRSFVKAIYLPTRGKIYFSLQVIEGPPSGIEIVLGDGQVIEKAAAGLDESANALYFNNVGNGAYVQEETPILDPGIYYLYLHNSFIERSTTWLGNISSESAMPAEINYTIKAWY